MVARPHRAVSHAPGRTACVRERLGPGAVHLQPVLISRRLKGTSSIKPLSGRGHSCPPPFHPSPHSNPPLTHHASLGVSPESQKTLANPTAGNIQARTWKRTSHSGSRRGLRGPSVPLRLLRALRRAVQCASRRCNVQTFARTANCRNFNMATISRDRLSLT
jgi:hypothetical protein